MPTVLVVDDERNMRTVLEMVLEHDGFGVSSVSTGLEAVEYIKTHRDVQLVISDVRLPDIDGIEVLLRAKEHDREIPIVLITAYGSIELAVDAMKKGAADFITKPFNKDVMRHVVRRVLSERSERGGEDPAIRRGISGVPGSLIAESEEMKQILRTARRIATAPTPVLITGESGSGKELVARAIHAYGGSDERGSTQPFVSISCPAVPASLLESEFFGYKKGAFTGATSDYPGKFVHADGGTLLLDEVGDLPMEVQPKLLRFLEEHAFQPLGGNEVVRVNARLICATNRDLETMVAQGHFREDLYYRINTITIQVPPLRERPDDIIPLSEHYLRKFSREMGKPARALSEQVKRAFLRHTWPGNVRELRNVVERGVVLATGSEITIEDLPPELRDFTVAARRNHRGDERAGSTLADSERSLLKEALERHDWNISAAARELGVSRNTLRYRIEKHNLRSKRS